MMNLKLKRNIRKSLLQGEPWIYRESVQENNRPEEACLTKILDLKGEFLGWAMFDPHSPICARMLSLQKQPPGAERFNLRMQQALELRQPLYNGGTNGFRLFNGEGDYLPGLVCDLYRDIAVLQFDGHGPYEFWDKKHISDWILKNTKASSVYFKPRSSMKYESQVWGQPLEGETAPIVENQIQFEVNVRHGQKTGFFLDQRDNRIHLKEFSKNCSVLNLFCYTGGFSVYAGVGGASQVVSVDISESALEQAERNWQLNDLPSSQHEVRKQDVFSLKGDGHEKFDRVICDPPSLAKSEKTKAAAIEAYINIFSQAAKMTGENGRLLLSSCSSHISFSDFAGIVRESLSKARKRGQVVRVSGQGIDHPYPHACPQLRYLKFYDLRVQ